MYLWVVLATFIAALYSYNLSVRSDLDRTFAETKASVIIAKFRALHNGVKDYFNSQAPSKTGQTHVTYYPGDGVNITSQSETNDDVLTVDMIRDYLPVGYAKSEDTIEDIATITGGGEIVSKVFCFEEGNTAQQCVSGGDGSCCSNNCLEDGTCAGIYVVSFTQMPSRWINKITAAPNADMKIAVAKVRGYGKTFGYTETINSKLVLSGGHMVQDYDEAGNPVGDKKFEYFEIWTAVQNDADFQRIGCTEENKHCLYAVDQIYG